MLPHIKRMPLSQFSEEIATSVIIVNFKIKKIYLKHWFFPTTVLKSEAKLFLKLHLTWIGPACQRQH